MEENEQPNQTVFKNGAVYDHDKKRIVAGAVLSSDRARELVTIREQKRRDMAKKAANEAVLNKNLVTNYGDMAYMAEIIQTAMQVATTPDNPQVIRAASFVMQLTGEAESAGGSSQSVPMDEVRGLVRDMADLARAVADANVKAESV